MRKIASRISLALAFLVSAGHTHVTLLSPEGGEDIAGGSTFTISWDADDHNCVYNLYFSPDSGANWSVIALGIHQDVRTHKWSVPEAGTEKAMVRILQDNVSGSDLDDRSAVFRIRASAAVRRAPAAAGLSLEIRSGFLEASLALEREEGVVVEAIDAGGRKAGLLRTRLPGGMHRLRLSLDGLPAAPGLFFKVQAGSRSAVFHPGPSR